MNEVDRQQPSIDTLREIETCVLWLATRIVDAANRRADTDVKRTSTATTRWPKPHASPVYHAIK